MLSLRERIKNGLKEASEAFQVFRMMGEISEMYQEKES